MTSKMWSLPVLVLTGLFLTGARAHAQTALQQLKLQAGEQAVAASAQLPASRAVVAALVPAPTVPLNAKDVFAQCQMFEEEGFSKVGWTLPQAAQVTQFCLNKSYKRAPGYSVTASVTPAGLMITVAGRVLTGDPVLMDLGYSLSKRGGKLLGYVATLDGEAAVLK